MKSLAEKINFNDSANNVYFQRGFRSLFEDHVNHIIDTNKYGLKIIKPIDAFRYQGDLFGYLTKEGIKKEDHWFIMVLSGMKSPDEMDVNTSALFIPTGDIMSKLRTYYLTNRRMTA